MPASRDTTKDPERDEEGRREEEFAEAKQRLEEMEEKIDPFVGDEEEYGEVETSGEWSSSDSGSLRSYSTP